MAIGSHVQLSNLRRGAQQEQRDAFVVLGGAPRLAPRQGSGEEEESAGGGGADGGQELASAQAETGDLRLIGVRLQIDLISSSVRL